MNLAGNKGEIKLYTTPWCPYCIRAKRLLNQKNVRYEDIDVSSQPEIRRALAQLTGRTSVPQIFIHGKGIGGSDELHELNRQGKLEAMIAGD